MDKRQYKLIELRQKLLARKRIRQFGIFALFIVPIIVGLVYLFDWAELKPAYAITTYVAIILLGFSVFYFLIIKPLEKYQSKLRQAEREEQDGN